MDKNLRLKKVTQYMYKTVGDFLDDKCEKKGPTLVCKIDGEEKVIKDQSKEVKNTKYSKGNINTLLSTQEL